MQDLRGNGMAMIFQEPMSSLNPAFTIGEQIVEGLLRHRPIGRAEAVERAIAMLRKVRIPAPEQRFHEHPHKLSGGMRQRAMIAMALACEPRLLIADEPTTALDVTIQAQILDLMRTLQRETGTAIILITHDLGVVAEVADEVVVMYAGRIVERAPVGRCSTRRSIPTRSACSARSRASTPSASGWPPSTARCRARCAGRPAAASRRAARSPTRAAAAQRPPLREVARHAGRRRSMPACWKAPLDVSALMAPAMPITA